MRSTRLPQGMRSIERALRSQRAVLDINGLGPGAGMNLGSGYLAHGAERMVKVPRPSLATLRGLERDAAAMLGTFHGAVAIVQTRDGWYALARVMARPGGGAGAFNVDAVGFNGSFAVRTHAGRGVRVAAIVGRGAYGSFTLEPGRL